MRADRRLAIMQPYFFPYLGYFQLMSCVNSFVIYDDVNFIKRGWINRNRIDINGAPHLLTVPLSQLSQNKRICEIELISDWRWRHTMLRTVQQAYARAPQFRRIFPLVESIVCHPARNLADYLLHSLTALQKHLGIATEIIPTSRHYENTELKAQARIIDICLRERAGIYINAIGGVELYSPDAFRQAGVKLRFHKPELTPYQQSTPVFLPALSILDVLMRNDEIAVKNLLQSGALVQEACPSDPGE
jgi:hypothetical protein